MNNVIEQIQAFKPDTFTSINVDVALLITKLNLSPREAYVLSILLQEYQSNFDIPAIRQHIYCLRNKLKMFGENVIASMGMGFYAIPDDIKEIIQSHIER
jgi:hypothetical protein